MTGDEYVRLRWKAQRYYARHGLRTFPTCWENPDHPGECGYHNDGECEQPGKRPATVWGRGGRGQRATTERVVQEVWSRRWELAGLAAATGDGLAVIDIDMKNDLDGDVSLNHLEDTYGDLPRTVTTLTRSGGAHLWLRVPEDVRVSNSTSSLGPGLDVRGDGGYVLMPPSPGYTFDTDIGLSTFDPAPAPEWLVDLVRVTETERGEGGTGGGRLDRAARGRLSGFVKYAPSGERNNRLYWAACRMYEAEEASSPEELAECHEELLRAAVWNGVSRPEAERTVLSASHATQR